MRNDYCPDWLRAVYRFYGAVMKNDISEGSKDQPSDNSTLYLGTGLGLGAYDPTSTRYHRGYLEWPSALQPQPHRFYETFPEWLGRTTPAFWVLITKHNNH